MEVRIEVLPKILLIGKSLRMSLVSNKTQQLWQSFMVNKKQITNTIGSDLYSIQVYDDSTYFQNFNPNAEFTKWACTQVSSHDNIPIGFNKSTIESGLYAVFLHKGLPYDFSKSAAYIFKEWLPNSTYLLDHRPHFEILGKKYKNNDPSSEEEIWIPIKNKA